MLTEKPQRFIEILKLTDGITPKVLAKELRDLEINQFIVRKMYATTPVTLLYEPTDYSATLNNVLYKSGHWGEKHPEWIKQSIRDSKVTMEKVGRTETGKTSFLFNVEFLKQSLFWC